MLVVNKATDEKEALRTFQSMESTTNQFLKIRVKNLGFIPEDKAVVKGVKSQKAYITLSPSAPAAKDLSRIVNCLITGKEEKFQGFQANLEINALNVPGRNGETTYNNVFH